MIKHDLIEQVGGIERAREIVDGAPDNTALHYSNEDGDLVYFRDGDYYDNDYGDWFEIYFMMPDLISLDTLRTAIAEHDSKIQCWACDKRMTEVQLSFNDGFCIHCESEIELSKPSKQLESDDCTDIRNHVSPSTKVLDL